MPEPIRRLLIANRGEIALRILRAARELGIHTVGLYTHEDRLAQHRFQADESHLVGAGRAPIEAYLDRQDVLRIARQTRVDAIHPGYGFLAENPEFAEDCEQAGVRFVGPPSSVMRLLGNKVAAKALAHSVGVCTLPATGPLPYDRAQAQTLAAQIGYPLMLKASWGGGGRGMRIVHTADELATLMESARRESFTAFGSDEIYLEKYVPRAHHVEVQILGDLHGTLVHLFERDCSVQRRHQKVVEQAPAPYVSDSERRALCQAALTLTRAAAYTHAGTVEFLMDADTRTFYFIEVNPRIQVEHTVTEEVTGIDIVKAQLRIAEGARIGDPASGVPPQEAITLTGHALQCRVTTEDPTQGFTPAHGQLTSYHAPTGFGIRLDAGTVYSGATITPFYDSLLVKITARGSSALEARQRMQRALQETRLEGVASNLQFLANVVQHAAFAAGTCTTRFIDETPELLHVTPRQADASKLLSFLGEIMVNGHPEMQGRSLPAGPLPQAPVPAYEPHLPLPLGSRDRLRQLGPERFLAWMRHEPRLLLTDTSMRDAQQSLLATRLRTHDILAVAPAYARLTPQLFSLECWGGATFDVMLRFLHEDPWERLAQLRQTVPNILLQGMVRASNAVGYTSYPDNVVRHFIAQAAAQGLDLFRVFDALNGVDNMCVAIEAVRKADALCEAAICYTGDLFDTSRPKWGLKYYIALAHRLAQAGAHILGIKDMAGVCRPRAARELIHALKQEVDIPIHFDTHDMSGIAAASVFAAIEAGADAVYGALDAMSGLTAQPNLSALAMAFTGTDRDPGVDPEALQALSRYWEVVRQYYAPFETDMRAGTASVYRHEMPGPQYTNLREQARSMGLTQRWAEICQMYAEVNLLFGDLVKITPTSTAVADMALYMVANGLTPDDVRHPERALNVPQSVVALLRGDVGFPPEGFPPALQHKVLKGQPAHCGRAAETLPAVDLAAQRHHLSTTLARPVSDRELASHLLFPALFQEYTRHQARFGDVARLPTPVFYYGLRVGEELTIDLADGKTFIIGLQGRTEPDVSGMVTVFFTLNGQPHVVRVLQAGMAVAPARPRAQADNPSHIGAVMAGRVVAVLTQAGQQVVKGTPLLCLEAMKMEMQLVAERAGTIDAVYVQPGEHVQPQDLLMTFAAEAGEPLQ